MSREHLGLNEASDASDAKGAAYAVGASHLKTTGGFNFGDLMRNEHRIVNFDTCHDGLFNAGAQGSCCYSSVHGCLRLPPLSCLVCICSGLTVVHLAGEFGVDCGGVCNRTIDKCHPCQCVNILMEREYTLQNGTVRHSVPPAGCTSTNGTYQCYVMDPAGCASKGTFGPKLHGERRDCNPSAGRDNPDYYGLGSSAAMVDHAAMVDDAGAGSPPITI